MTVKPTIPHAVFEGATAARGRVAIRGVDGFEIAYAELESLARSVAASLIERGVEAGDRVALWAPNSPGWIIATLGVQAAGAVLVPINTRLKGREAAHILSKSEAKYLLTIPEFLGVRFTELIAPFEIGTLRDTLIIDEHIGLAPAGRASEPLVSGRLEMLSPDDLSDIIFTSGTTGLPKGVMTAHGQNIRIYSAYAEGLGLRQGDISLAVNPFFHTFGYKAGWMVALMRGCTVLPQPQFDAAAILKRIAHERISVLPGPPTIYQSLLALPVEAEDISSLRLAITGAAKVPEALIHEMRNRLGIDTVLTAYGLTENCGVVTMCRPNDPVEIVANTAGRPIEGVAVEVRGDDGLPAQVGDPGHLFVRGAGVMCGYVGDPEATERVIDESGWLRTGDVAVIDGRGNIAITDRSDDMFTVGGFNAYPAEIEGLISAHPAILQVAVIGVPDERLGSVPHAYCVLRPGANVEPDALIAWCRREMANYKAPRRISFVVALPTNAAGKVQKFALRALNHDPAADAS